jgi:predicted acylesterase/phospholipase RssA
MALANIAERFREQGLRVVMVDWDLEAPGLESYFYSPDKAKECRNNPGLMDLLQHYKSTFALYREQRSRASAADEILSRKTTNFEQDREDTIDKLREQLSSSAVPEFLRERALETLRPEPLRSPSKSLREFLDESYRTAGGDEAGPGPPGSPLRRFLQPVLGANLYMLGAGARGSDRFSDYANSVQEFDWSEFYAVYEGRGFFEWLRECLLNVADVVLIDSRTGVTEMGGVCTRQMPDAVVSFCAPNWQNVDGVSRVIAGLNEEKLRISRQNRDVDVLVIPTRIDDAESTLLGEFRERFMQTVETQSIPQEFQGLEAPLWNLQIPYIPRYNYREQRVIGPGAADADPPTQRLIAAYRKIAAHLAVLADDKAKNTAVREAFAGEIAQYFGTAGHVPRLTPRVAVAAWVERPALEARLREQLLKSAESGTGARSAVWGRAGTGKSTLVARLCASPEVEAAFPDGTVWLSGDRDWTAERIHEYFRSNFGMQSGFSEAKVRQELAGRRFLVVVDDINEKAAADRVFSLSNNATCVAITRDLAIASAVGSSVLRVGDFTTEETIQIFPASAPIAPAGSAAAIASWPAGAGAMRSTYDKLMARSEDGETVWNDLQRQIEQGGIAAFDVLATPELQRSMSDRIREALGQLEPAEERTLIARANRTDSTQDGSGGEDTRVLNRLCDYGLLDASFSVYPVVREWLVYVGKLRGTTQQVSDEDRAKLETAKQGARLILRGKSETLPEIVRIAGQLKNTRDFSLARRLLALATHGGEFNRADEKTRLKLTQQHALCTYRDPELPASERYARALEILESGDLNAAVPSQETLGLAGAVFKYRWRYAGQRRDLERSFSYYDRGARQPLAGDYGYTRINAAFVLDLIAQQEQDDSVSTVQSRRDLAKKLRQEIVDQLPILAAGADGQYLKRAWWYYATLAEACFGQQLFESARFWLRKGMALEVPGWEKESTIRQLADLASAQGLKLAEGSEEWRTLRIIAGDAVEALRAMSVGKVGLALSGGGFRAALFHIGVLARLAEADLLRHVEVLSCVSGGSITGAHLYLELRRILQANADQEITREHYIEAVRCMQYDVLDGIQKNLRTILFRKWGANLRTLWQPGYTRTHTLGALFEQEIFARIKDGHQGPRYINELRIKPEGEPTDFNPKIDNWRRSAKAPILLLNATTLNTGHNWQFAVTWMGEPPASLESVDSNDVLRRMYYKDEAPEKYKRVRLGHAVAASACVPSLFDPLEMPDLYPERTVRLVDGGVHDNQGTAGLLEQECRVMLISDASGHMNSEHHPSAEVAAVPMRANSILMARVRESEFRELSALERSSALNGMMFLHLKKDLNVEHVDWVGCEDPFEGAAEGRLVDPGRTLTPYGIPRSLQGLLAGIRTDLDTFCDAEAYSLMLSGYRMTDQNLREALPQLAHAEARPENWHFLKVAESLRNERLVRVLERGRSRAFKIWKLSRSVMLFGTVGTFLAVAVIVRTAILAWRLEPPSYHLPTLILLPSLPVAAAAVSLLGIWTLHRFFGSRKSFTVIATGLVMVTAGWLLAAIHLAIFDPLYRRYGRIRVDSRPDRAHGDIVSNIVVALLVIVMLIVGGWAVTSVTRTPDPSLINDANNELRERHYQAAATTYSAILGGTPSFEAFAGRAYAERMQGDYNAALADDSQALNLRQTAQVLRDRAYVYKLLDQLKNSQQDLQRSLALEDEPSAYADFKYIDTLLQAGSRLYVHPASKKQEIALEKLRLNIALPIVVVPVAEINHAVATETQVRYFLAQDRETAQKLTAQLRKLGLKVGEAIENPEHAEAGHLELWLAPDATLP